MRLEVQDVHDGELTDVQWLSERVMRFRFGGERPVQPYLAALLEGRESHTIFPDAPRREAAAQILARVRKDYQQALERWQAGPEPLREVRTLPDLVRRVLAHLRAPLAAYTNGQVVMTLVELGPGRYELARHAHLPDVFHACSDVHFSRPPDPDHLRWFASIEAAEHSVLADLSVVSCRSLPLADRSSGEPLPGEVWVERVGVPQRVLVRHADGVARWTPYTDPGDARTLLLELRPGGACVRACGTCRHFQFSGMSHDMSGGESGYCMRRGSTNRLPDAHHSRQTYSQACSVGAFELCPSWEPARAG